MSHALRLVPRHFLTTALLFGLSCAAAIATTPAAQPAKSPAPSQAQLAQTYGKLPLRFESNNGQTDPSVKFLSRGSAYSLYLTNSAAVLSLAKGKAGNTDSIRMELSGANPQAKAAGADQLPGVTNYFIGNDPAKWHINIPTYTKVQYSDIYPGVDLVYYGNQRQLEYDFVIAPGASPDTIPLTPAVKRRPSQIHLATATLSSREPKAWPRCTNPSSTRKKTDAGRSSRPPFVVPAGTRSASGSETTITREPW